MNIKIFVRSLEYREGFIERQTLGHKNGLEGKLGMTITENYPYIEAKNEPTPPPPLNLGLSKNLHIGPMYDALGDTLSVFRYSENLVFNVFAGHGQIGVTL